MQANTYEETSFSKNSLEDVKHQCLSEILVNVYVHVHQLCNGEKRYLAVACGCWLLPNLVYLVNICNKH